jgi:hypothetical protein
MRYHPSVLILHLESKTDSVRTFKIGDKVILISDEYGTNEYNPVNGSEFACVGEIVDYHKTKIDTPQGSTDCDYDVLWSNGNRNCYHHSTLRKYDGVLLRFGSPTTPTPKFKRRDTEDLFSEVRQIQTHDSTEFQGKFVTKKKSTPSVPKSKQEEELALCSKNLWS